MDIIHIIPHVDLFPQIGVLTMRSALLLLAAVASCHAAPSIRYHSEFTRIVMKMLVVTNMRQ